MSNKVINARVKQKRDTDSNWQSKNPVLLNGEIILVDMSDGELRAKIGDGTSAYNLLSFTDEPLRNLIGTIDSKVNTIQNLVGDTSVSEQISTAVANKADLNHTHSDYATIEYVDSKVITVVTGASVGQTIKIAAVDENGVPTAWESVDFPSGGSESNDHVFYTSTEPSDGMNAFLFDHSEIETNGRIIAVGDWIVTPSGKVYVVFAAEDYGIDATYDETLTTDTVGNADTVDGMHASEFALVSDLSELQTEVGALTSDVSDLHTKVNDLQTDVNELQIDVSDLQTDVGALASDISELQTKVGDQSVSDQINSALSSFSSGKTLTEHLSEESMVLTSLQYGDTLPNPGTVGRIFFLKVSE